MTDINKLVEIGLKALKVKPSNEFSAQDCKVAFDGEVSNNFGCKNYADFMRVKPDVFELITEMATEYLPERLVKVFGPFAEIRRVGNGQKLEFKLRKGHQRGRSFVTQVAPSGQYETFRLDVTQFTVPVKAYGAAAVIEWERFLNGDESFIELMQIIAEGIEDRIYEQIQGMLQGAASSMPSANVKTHTAFDESRMDALIGVVRAYGTPEIWCTHEFAATMTNMTSLSGSNPNMPAADLEDIRNYGHIRLYKGVQVNILPQSFVDENNQEKIVNPQYAYVIPAGEEKIVKIIMEGDTQVREYDKDTGGMDWSTGIQMYQKVGLAIVTNPNYWGIYQNSNLA